MVGGIKAFVNCCNKETGEVDRSHMLRRTLVHAGIH